MSEPCTHTHMFWAKMVRTCPRCGVSYAADGRSLIRPEDAARAKAASASAARRAASHTTGRAADLDCGFMGYDDFGNN